MKRIAILGFFLIGSIIFSGCNKTENSIPTDNELFYEYEHELVIEGVTPNAMIGGDLTNGTLVLKETYEDYTDVVIFPKGTWESYFEDENDTLPGNTIAFKGEIKSIDAAAGTHYYEVSAIDSLSLVSYPNKEEVEEFIGRYNYCETDEDCVDFYPGCPLGCSNPINIEYQDIATKIAENFRNHQENQCAYGCMAPVKITCENYKCTIITEQNNQNNDSEGNRLLDAERQEANSIFAN